MGGSTSYPWPTASRPCLCVGAARGLLVVVRKADTDSPAPDTASSCNTHNIAHVALIHQCQIVAGKPSDTLQRLTNLDRVHWHQRTSWPRARESARMPPAESTPCAPAHRRAGHRPRRSPCQPCRVCPTPGCLRLNRLGSGSYHLPSLVWMSSRASLSHVLLCSRSAVALSPRPGKLRSAPLRPDDPWSGMWGRCGPNSGALNDGLTLADPLSQGAQLSFSSQPRASSLERCDRPGKRYHEYELASRCRSGVPSFGLKCRIGNSKMRAMRGDPVLPARGCGPGAMGHRKPCLN